MSLLDDYYERYDTPPTDLATKLVFAFISDLTGRGGFDGVWDSLDTDIREEMLDDLHAAVAKVLTES